MADNRIQLPQSGGGLLRYSEGHATKFRIKPEFVIGMIVVVILISIMLHTKLFGLI